MKIDNTLGVIAALILSASAPAEASGWRGARSITVYPTGHHPQDVQNVQAAVDQLGQRGRRGRLVLAAVNAHGVPTAFNFGTSPDPTERGTVTIGAEGSGALEIIGVREGEAATTIVGGLTSIVMDRQDNIKIRNLRFEGAQECGICIFRAARVSISGNEVLGTMGVRFLPSISASAIRVAPPSIFDPTPTILGRVDVRNNLVDGVQGVYPNGISIFNTDGRIVVRDNCVYGVAGGIRVEGEVRAPVRIIRNHVVIVQNPELEELFGPGITRFGITGQGTLAATPSDFVIRDNLIETHVSDFISAISVFPFNGVGFPIFAFTSSRIVHNTIILGGEVTPGAAARFGVELFAGSARIADVTVARNQISGNASRAFSFEGAEDPALGPRLYEDNRIVGNDLSHLTVTEASIFLDPFTRDNLYRGRIGDIVVDQGVDNRVILRN